MYKDNPVEKIVEKVVYKEKKSSSGGGSRGDPRLPNGSPKVTIKIGNTVGFFYDIEKWVREIITDLSNSLVLLYIIITDIVVVVVYCITL